MDLVTAKDMAVAYMTNGWTVGDDAQTAAIGLIHRVPGEVPVKDHVMGIGSGIVFAALASYTWVFAHEDLSVFLEWCDAMGVKVDPVNVARYKIIEPRYIVAKHNATELSKTLGGGWDLVICRRDSDDTFSWWLKFSNRHMCLEARESNGKYTVTGHSLCWGHGAQVTSTSPDPAKAVRDVCDGMVKMLTVIHEDAEASKEAILTFQGTIPQEKS